MINYKKVVYNFMYVDVNLPLCLYNMRVKFTVQCDIRGLQWPIRRLHSSCFLNGCHSLQFVPDPAQINRRLLIFASLCSGNNLGRSGSLPLIKK